MGQARQPPRRHHEPGRPPAALAVLDQGEAPASAPPGRLGHAHTAGPAQLFPFCQFEFSFLLGPADGRYLARAQDGEQLDVVIFTTLGAPRRRLIRGRRPRAEEAGAAEPQPVPVTRASAVATEAFGDEAQASNWLERCRSNADARDRLVDQGLRVVNRAIHAHRLAAADPHVHEVGLAQAQLVRAGYGSGDQLVGGRWSAAYVLPRPRRRTRRGELIEPQQELARIIGGRSHCYASEDLALRARLDLDQGRTAQAALQLEAALSALSAELDGSEQSDARSRALLERREQLRRIATDALRQPSGGADRKALSEAMIELERLLRRRRHAPQQR